MENGTFKNRFFSNRYFLALIYGIYIRIHRTYLIIYLFRSKLLLIFTNTKENHSKLEVCVQQKNSKISKMVRREEATESENLKNE